MAQPAKSMPSSAILTATVTLTHADILALHDTPKRLVSAAGAGKMIAPLLVILVANTMAGAYTTDNLRFQHDVAGAVPSSLDNQSGAPLIGSPDRLVLLVPGAITEGPMPVAGYDNTPLYLSVWNANPTGGHPNNTLSVTVLYTLVDL